MNLSSDCFIKNFFDRKFDCCDCFIKNFFDRKFDYLSKNGKRNWVSVVLSSKMHYLSFGQGLILSPYFEQCMKRGIGLCHNLYQTS